MFCSKCGNQMEDSASFCSKCGNSVSEAMTSAPAVLFDGGNSHIEKAPEYGEKLTSTEVLDPHYKTVVSVIKVLRVILCIAMIWDCLGEYSFIVLILVIAVCIWISKMLEKLVLFGYEHFKTKNFEATAYSYYVNTQDAELIASVLMGPMLTHGIRMSVRNENVIDISYGDKKYAVAFVTEPGSFFVVVSDADNENKYVNLCNDVPVIAFYIQDILRNL
ncbi:MAG: zinc ribbon domain-containing protein [Oscillospiraceae bacterium]|nr:zinc ribbon domain-containing protein [Oscillospiraceae bacterium]